MQLLSFDRARMTKSTLTREIEVNKVFVHVPQNLLKKFRLLGPSSISFASVIVIARDYSKEIYIDRPLSSDYYVSKRTSNVIIEELLFHYNDRGSTARELL